MKKNYKQMNGIVHGLLALLILFLSLNGFGEEQKRVATNLYLVDVPTANTLLRGTYDAFVRVYPAGGLVAKIVFGFHDRLLFGGGVNLENVIGTGPVLAQAPRFIFKWKIMEENRSLPSWALGYDGIGYGLYDSDTGVWQRKQKGFYTALTKEFKELGYLQFTLGISHVDSRVFNSQKDWTPFGGAAAAFSREVVLNLEYDDWLREEGGSFNVGLGYHFDPAITIEFDVRELFRTTDKLERSLRIQYNNYI